MRPKNRRYCRAGKRLKILFETEEKADNFIKFNAREIEAENGYHPIRSYYCSSCCGFHVTSKEKDEGQQSRAGKTATKIILQRKLKAKFKRRVRPEKRLKRLDKKIRKISHKKERKDPDTLLKNISICFEQLTIAKQHKGSKHRIKKIEQNLYDLRREIKARKNSPS